MTSSGEMPSETAHKIGYDIPTNMFKR